MPMSFPDLDSLIHAAKTHGFRLPLPDEPEPVYRAALARHVRFIDRIEAHEIRTGKGWDQWTPQERTDFFRE